MTRTRFAILLALAATALLFVRAKGVAPQAPAARTEPIFRGSSAAVRFDVSPPLAELARLAVPPRAEVEDEQREDDGPTGLEGALGPQDVDPLVQRGASAGDAGEMPSPIVSFDGMSNPDSCGGCSPPDPNGAVGPNHYVQMVNVKFQIFNKLGGSLFGPSAINILWAGFGGACQTENAGDPVVLYDHFADRWLLTQFTSAGPTWYNCVALSQTADPTGSYYRWAFTTGNNFPDYPKYGIWADGYYISTREFINGGAFGGIGMYALNKAAMLIGTPNPTVISFLVPPTAAYVTGDGYLPADIDGYTLPPAGAPEYFIGSQDNGGPYGAPSDALNLFKFHADFGVPGNSSLTGPIVIATAPFDSILSTCTGRACIPQPTTAVRIDHLGYRQRPLHRAAYRNFGSYEAIVTNQSVEASAGISGIRWWELRSPNSSPFIFQEGTYSPDAVHRWMGSIAQDHAGDMALGYSVSDSSSVFPGIRYVGRLQTSGAGTMPLGETTLINGGGAQTSSNNRWGDYSAMTVDPKDDCTFWYTDEYYAATGTAIWKTRIGSVKLPNCEYRRPAADIDGDFKSDRVIYRPTSGIWYTLSSKGTAGAVGWGISGDVDAMADYDGDGRADIAVFRPSSGTWFIVQSATGTVRTDSWGTNGDIPVPGDIDGDTRADLVLFRPSTGVWFAKWTGGSGSVSWGMNGDVPMLADFDGDGRKDIVIFRPSNGVWYVVLETGSSGSFGWGVTGDIPVVGDFDGDGLADATVFRPSSGLWFVQRSTGGTTVVGWGASGDVPVSGDLDGDGKSDFTIWRPTTGVWFSQLSGGGFATAGWGVPGDKPVGRVPGS